MSWVYLDDKFDEHPKVIAAGDEAAWLYVSGLLYVNRNLTGGRIPKAKALRLTSHKNAAKLADRLVTVGLWEDHGDEYRIHDYDDHNSSAMERKEKARKAAASRWNGTAEHASSIAQASVEHDPSIGRASPEHVPKEDTEQCSTLCVSNAFPQAHTHAQRSYDLCTDVVEQPQKVVELVEPEPPPDELFAAIAQVCGFELGKLTAPMRGQLNRTARELREVGATPFDVRERAASYRLQHPTWAFTPSALSKWWGSLGPDRALAPPISANDATLLRFAAKGELA